MQRRSQAMDAERRLPERPLRAPRPASTTANGSARVEAATRAARVEVASSWSASRIKAASSTAARRCHRQRKSWGHKRAAKPAGAGLTLTAPLVSGQRRQDRCERRKQHASVRAHATGADRHAAGALSPRPRWPRQSARAARW
jgi:hypothetical protein